MNILSALAPQSRSNPGRRAFTRLELIVVLSVLAILGLVMVSAMAATAERSQRAKCQDNLRRLAIGVTVFAGNNNGNLFSARTVSPGGSPTVQIALDPVEATKAAQVGLTLATNGVWTCPDRPGFPTYEPAFPQYNIGYQYFGGMRFWNTIGYSGPSRSPTNLTTAQPHWALAADAVIRINGTWGGVDRDAAYAHLPPHHAENSLIPQGGNQAFVDGSVQWIQAEKMFFLSSWSTTARQAYWYQDPKDFPTALKNLLPNLRLQP